MPHADASLVPSSIQTKQQFWRHVHSQLGSLLEGQRHWVTNLANASSLVYNSLCDFPVHFGSREKAVNWCGFYVDSRFFPQPRLANLETQQTNSDRLLLGPFCGKPACQFISVAPGKAQGVCADAYLQQQAVVVPDVDAYPGHIACDGHTKSEIVVPLKHESENDTITIGVMDLDCLAVAGFDDDDRLGLEGIADLIVKSCDW